MIRGYNTMKFKHNDLIWELVLRFYYVTGQNQLRGMMIMSPSSCFTGSWEAMKKYLQQIKRKDSLKTTVGAHPVKTMMQGAFLGRKKIWVAGVLFFCHESRRPAR